MGQPADETPRTALDRARFELAHHEVREALRAGANVSVRNVASGHIEPPRPEDFLRWPGADDPEHAGYMATGRAALARGEVALLLLAGGMATRFGGVVKALVPVDGARSFLDLKALDVLGHRRTGATVPLLCLSSFATHDGLCRALSGIEDAEAVLQYEATRLTAAGDDAHDAQGRASRAATGHGDVGPALLATGALARLRARGVRTLFVCNVDNLTATLDPSMLAAHRLGGAEVTVEVAPKRPGDRGGAPARLDGHPQVIEGFRFPAAFDQDTIPVFNTNSLWVELDVLERDPPLDYFAVEKVVDGAPLVQLERLVGQLTAFARTRFVTVARDGVQSRFAPVKDVTDMAASAAPALAALRARGVLPP